MNERPTLANQLRDRWRTRLWSHRLPPHRVIEARTGWPLLLLPFLVFGQLVTPHPVWSVLIVTLVTLYTIGYLWVREQVAAVTLVRRRTGAILVAASAAAELMLTHDTAKYLRPPWRPSAPWRTPPCVPPRFQPTE